MLATMEYIMYMSVSDSSKIPVPELLEWWRKKLNWTKTYLAEKAQISNKTYDRILNNETYENETLEKIIKAFGFETIWEMYEAYKREQEAKEENLLERIKRLERIVSEGTRLIPLISIVEAGKHGLLAALESPIGMIEIPVRRADLYAFRVEGDSMEPRILQGDIVVVAQESEPQIGDLVVVKFKEGETLLKWLKKKDKVCLFKSFNPHVDDIYANEDEIEFMHKVILIIPKGSSRKIT